MPASSVDVNQLALRRGQWVPIRLAPAGVTPWGTFTGYYDPVSRSVYLRYAVWGLMDWSQVPPGLATRIENDAGLPRPRSASDGGASADEIGAGLALAAAAAGGILLAVHRARRQRPRPLGSA